MMDYAYSFPCKDCTDRFVGCHGSCQKYKDAKAEHERKRAVIKKAKDEEERFVTFKVETIRATRKNK